MSIVVKGELTGLKDTLALLHGMKLGLRNRILRKALRAGSKPIIKLARALVPQRTRQMRKALGLALRAYTSGVVAMVIGVRKGFRVEIDGKWVNPEKYLHLVLFGRKAISAADKVFSDGVNVFGKEVKAAKGNNFLKAAYDGAKAEAEAAIKRVVVEELIKLGK